MTPEEWFFWLCGGIAVAGIAGLVLVGMASRKPDNDDEWWI